MWGTSTMVLDHGKPMSSKISDHDGLCYECRGAGALRYAYVARGLWHYYSAPQ